MAELAAELQRFLDHLAVERRLAARTVAMYREALARLQASAAAAGVELKAAQPHHIRSWVAQLRSRGLAPGNCISTAWPAAARKPLPSRNSGVRPKSESTAPED